ncbi:MAG: cytochrome c, partial [Planctomycetaceae bacterium]|nr:cytochrome c [Planctomycetaceae bacterium]
SHRAEYDDLEPYAQDYVDAVLNSYFGSPTEMVVWDRLPLNLHLAEGAIASANDRTLTFELAEPHGEVAPGTEILWVNPDSGETSSGWVREWDESSHSATLDEKLAQIPIEGSPVIVGPAEILVRGRHLYGEHCQHCHGVAGDGAGPTARYLNPRPRDYRKGIFKFTTTQASERICRDDLSRIIEDGIPGTYMPSFKLLTDDEMESIIEYVMWLSMRGEVEYKLVKFLSESYTRDVVLERIADARTKRQADLQAAREAGTDPPDREYETYASIRQEFFELAKDPDEFPIIFEETIDLMVSQWESAQQSDALVRPTDHFADQNASVVATALLDQESVKRGRALYLSADLNCVACHGEAGYGDGAQTYTITKNLETGEENPEPGLYDHWGNPIAPRNLHTGIFRGGRRPLDLYCRIHAGIKGTPMPAFGAKLKDQQIWDIVNYVYSVPYEEENAGTGEPAAKSGSDGVASLK